MDTQSGIGDPVVRSALQELDRKLRDHRPLKRLIIQDTYPILFATKLYLQAWPLEEAEFYDPDKSSNPALFRNVAQDGTAP